MKKSPTLWLLFAAIMFVIGGCASNSPTQSATPGEFIDDAVITSKVKSAFVSDQKVSALNIGVETNKGVVALSGVAQDRQEVRKAVEIAQNVQGVRAVQNNITIRQ
jgi:osmotically-inducible protein OsmY